jgi:hypothetical protein
MKTTYPTHTGSYLYLKIEQHSDSNFFHELTDRPSDVYSNHHHSENDLLYPVFEDEYDSYNSDFDLDTK